MKNPPKRPPTPKPGEAPAPSKAPTGTPPGVDPLEYAAADRGRALVYVGAVLAALEPALPPGVDARLRDVAPDVAFRACAARASGHDAQNFSAAASMCSKWSFAWSDLDGARVVRLSGRGGSA